MEGILGKLGNNFLVAAFIPALGFVVIAQLIFSPILPQAIQENLVLTISRDGETLSLFPLIFTLLIGYTLLGLNTFIYKAIEGYYWPKRLTFFKKRQMKKAIKRKVEYKVIDAALEKLFDEATPLQDDAKKFEVKLENGESLDKNQLKLLKRYRILRRKIEYLEQLSYEYKAQFKQDYPLSISTLLPTRFGNILRAAELYSNEHYGMDAVTLWPRLIHVMDESYYQKLDESNNGLAFITNSMVLSAILALLCFLAAGYQAANWRHATNAYNEQYLECLENKGEDDCKEEDFTGTAQLFEIMVEPEERTNYLQWAISYIVLFTILLGFAYFLYNASLPAARQYGNLIRSAYDLFRFDLTKQLRLELPENSLVEHDTWARWSEFVALGNLERSRSKFEYHHPSDSE